MSLAPQEQITTQRPLVGITYLRSNLLLRQPVPRGSSLWLSPQPAPPSGQEPLHRVRMSARECRHTAETYAASLSPTFRELLGSDSFTLTFEAFQSRLVECA